MPRNGHLPNEPERGGGYVALVVTETELRARAKEDEETFEVQQRVVDMPNLMATSKDRSACFPCGCPVCKEHPGAQPKNGKRKNKELYEVLLHVLSFIIKRR